MADPIPKGFKVPRIRRQENKDNLRQVDVTSRDATETVKTVLHSYLERDYRSPWQLKSVHFIENRELEERYRQKKAAMKDAMKDARSSRDIVDQFAFLMFRDASHIQSLVKNGLKCRSLPVNTLGDSKLGVYVCRNADIQLRLAENWGLNSCTLIVFKMVLGKCKVMAGQVGDDLVEPTPNYDCHVHQSQPNPSHSLNAQLARSQVYLYEYTDDCEPSPIPRQCLPYAILTYEMSEIPSQPSYQTATDSYSRRPGSITESKSDSTDLESTQKSDSRSRKDPRKSSILPPDPKSTNPADPRQSYQRQDEGGLCVPRLTAGPPPQDARTAPIPASVAPPSDPRLNKPVDPLLSGPPTSAQLVLQQLAKDPRITSKILTTGPVQVEPILSAPPIMSGQPTSAQLVLQQLAKDPRITSQILTTGVPPPGVPPPHSVAPPGIPAPHSVAPPGIPAPHVVPPHGIPPPHGVPPHGIPPPHGVPPHGIPPPHGVPPHGIPLPGVLPPGVPPPGVPHSAAPGFQPGFFPPAGLRGPIPVPPPNRPQDPRLLLGQDPNSTYQPSFGPTEQEIETRLALLKQVNEKLPSHARKDPRLQSREDPRRRDPRLQKTDENRPLDPRVDRKEEDIIKNRDPRMRRHHHRSKPSGDGDDGQDRKKLSLHEYKQKVTILPAPKPETSTIPESYSAKDSLITNHPEIGYNSPKPFYTSERENTETDLSDYPPLESPPSPESDEETDEQYNPFIPTDVVEGPHDMYRTLNELSDPDDISMSPKDLSASPKESSMSPKENSMSSKDVSVSPKEVSESPKETSVSPKETAEHDEEEEDPVLAEAMKKLVEYTSDVPLFTAALRSLQESAEEYGDSLTNPVFLVKKIAEYIDHLANDKEKNAETTEETSENKSELSSDNKTSQSEDNIYDEESIKSPDSAEIPFEKTDLKIIPVPEIPLESEDQNSNQNTSPSEVFMSPMSKAMKKTLDEYIPEAKPTTLIDKKPGQAKIDLCDIPLPASPKQPPVKDTFVDIKSEKRKPGFSFNMKKRGTSPITVANIFRDDEMERDRDMEQRRLQRSTAHAGAAKRQVFQADDDVDLRNMDKDFRSIVKSEASLDLDFRTGKAITTVSVDIQSSSDKKGVPVYKPTKIPRSEKSDMFDYSLDKDDRFSQKSKKRSHEQYVPKRVVVDPSYLDRDDRQTHSKSGSPQPLSSVFMDIDERSNSSTSLSAPFKHITEDCDERIKSRSQSPSIITTDNGSKSMENTVKCVVKPEKILPSSDLQDPIKSPGSHSDSQDSSRDSGGLFDAYAINKKPEPTKPAEKQDKKVVENEFGDVDWRMQAAAEMGDVDLRGSQSNVSQRPGEFDFSGRVDQGQTYPDTSSSYYITSSASAYSHHPTSVEQYHTAVAPVDVYSTGKSNYEAYSTSRGPIASYSTHGSYQTSGPPAVGGNQPGNLQNLMQNLDFSNLKNILATVQQAPATSNSQGGSAASEVPGDDDDDHEDKPAFCTGLSFLKSKQPKIDLARSKYSGIAKVPSDVGPPPVPVPVRLPAPPVQPIIRPVQPPAPKPQLSSPPSLLDPSLLDLPLHPVKPGYESPSKKAKKSLFDSPLFDSSTPKAARSNIIPGFDDHTDDEEMKEKDSPQKPENTKRPFKFSEEIPDRDFSSEWYETGTKQEHKTDNKLADDRGSRSKTDTRKDDAGSDRGNRDSGLKESGSPSKSKRKADTSTPKYTSSWQQAILESIEESALKVRNEDSFTTEPPESPIIEPKCAKILFDESDSKKRKLDDADEDKRKAQKVETEIKEDVDHESDDDDEEALIIDLTAETSMAQDAMPGSPTKKVPLTEDGKDSQEQEDTDVIDLDKVVDKEDEGTDLEDELEAGEILEGDAVVPTKSDEMKTMIEKSRKNMVIKLKGETKIVNPKTGKAYNDSVVGSAIQVVGQASKKPVSKPEKQPSPTFSIHSVHGGSSSSVPSKPGSQISAVSQRRYRSPSPVTTSKVSGISTLVSGGAGFRTTSPVNQISSLGSTQAPPISVKQYVHPLTGQSVVYGTVAQPAVSSSAQVLPVVGQPPGFVGIPGVPVPIRPNPTVLVGGVVQQPPFVLVGPGPQLGQISPVGLSPTMDSQVRPPQPNMSVPPPQVNILVRPSQPNMLPQVNMLVRPSQPNMPPQPNMPVRTSQPNMPVRTSQPNMPVRTSQPNMPVRPSQPNMPVRPPQPNMPIQTIGQPPAKTPDKKPPERKQSASDVFDWFSDKFEKRNPGEQRDFSPARDTSQQGAFSPVEKPDTIFSTGSVPTRPEPNYQFSQNNANKIITIVPESNLRQIDTSYRSDDSSFDRKRPARQSEAGSDPKKFCQTPIDSDASKNVSYKGNLISISTTETSQTDSQTSSKTKDGNDTADSSELEDGEISDDSADELLMISPVKQNSQNYRRVVIQPGNSNIRVIGSGPASDPWNNPYSGPAQRIPTLGSNFQESPKRIINVKSEKPRHIPSLAPGRAASDWSMMLQTPDHSPVEKLRAAKPPYPAKGQDDASALLSMSASISKTKQKIVARSQVKTLGDWLKVELETDNIQPLQNIIPYSLNTDLSIIPKQRRRKIRLKVKNAIEQEGMKKLKVEARPESPVQVEVEMEMLPSTPEKNSGGNGTSAILSSPEVEHRQIERELSLINKAVTNLRSECAVKALDIRIPGMQDPQSLVYALASIESEMKILLQRTCFYGYPNRRVPNELLLEAEMQSFRSQMTDVFLILMMPISAKPYHKLLQMKHDLERLCEEITTDSDKEAIQDQMTNIHSQRQAILRSFTGYLNKRRIQKIQDNVDKYTNVYDFFKHQQPPVPDSMLKFIRTTQMDLRQHLILAKQYFAIEEKKLQSQ